MTSKERISTVIAQEEVDHVPLHFRTFYVKPPPPLKWTNDFERVDCFLDMGLDDVLEVTLPLVTPHPEVRIRYWKEERPGERYPILCKEYDTPAGILRHEIYKTDGTQEDWMAQPEDPPLLDDFNLARAKKHAVLGPDDLPKLRYVFHEPSGEQLKDFRKYMKRVRRFADERQVAISGWVAYGTEAAVYLMGVEGALFAAMDRPDFFKELLEHIHKIDLCHFEIMIEEGVDILVRRGWCDTTRFWSPVLYRKFMVPHFRELVKVAHQAGRKVAHTMDCGIMPLLDDFLEIGFDLLYNLDPVQGGADLKIVKQKLGGHIALQGGVNEAITLLNNDREEIRRAVQETMEILSPGGGFILSVSNCLEPGIPWPAIKTVVDTWKEMI